MSDLTKEQSVAAQAITQWLASASSPWLFTLSGFAGTGKTFLLQRLINDMNKDKLRCCAPTGKAASVLQSKLRGIYVQTIHQMLYVPNSRSIAALEGLIAAELHTETEEDKSAIKEQIAEEKRQLMNSDVKFHLKDNDDLKKGMLIIIDEGSMVEPNILKDLEKTMCKVLIVGDTGQLPPVNGKNWFLMRDHDAKLVSIQRQAEGSPIIRLSMQIREGRVDKESFCMGDCRIMAKEDVDPEEWMAADQILTGRNASRHKINRFIRKRLKRKRGVVVEGERLICLKNDWRNAPPFVNGVQFEALSDSEVNSEGANVLDILYEDKEILGVEFHPFNILDHYTKDIEQDPPEFRRGLLELDYAYAVTVHKSQGSEWDNVLVADDKMQKSNRPFRQKWLYTAVTRAQRKLTIAQ